MPDPKAIAFKEKGNASFKAGDYPSAIGHYTSAILADRTDLTFPLNRAAAYLKLGKFEDTERDCNTVLTLSAPKTNVKALFRRGQARVGMGNLLEAQKDFSDVLLQEPSNASAAEELKNLAVLIQKEKAKKSKSNAPVSVPTSSTPASNGTPVKRRRVPIRIVGDTADIKPSVTSATATPSTSSKVASTSTATTTPISDPTTSKIPPSESKTIKTSSNGTTDTLQAVSSRSLKSPQPPAPSTTSATPGSPPPAPTTQPQPQPVKPKPDSFKDAKLARDSKNATSNTKPPTARVGGGIFRASGENTIFPTRGNAPTPNTSSAPKDVQMDTTPPPPVATPTPVAPPAPMVVSSPPPKPPSTLFEFSKAWYGIKDPWERWALMNTIPPSSLPELCKTSLEPSLLVSILDVFLTVLGTSNNLHKQTIHAYMDNMTRIPRFSTVVLFLSKPEKEVAREVWKALGVDRPEGVWKGVV
ncbi:RNA polymerase II-associated protein 3 [Psilocybe cubensis]|uniref:RNA polymerase II-associated protein 3 n=1 Tax=Psilocybe cubensis TaxID=181762 RepID=A0ACB8GX30_PSICU|nr:RNA polymerase II-associated protein 3 [Psilocybe cubensis]KAH9480186.1 RNA polymerase II-associated protein 3 [Psilocybe cubensis]